jgi:hypothetical protein
MTTKSAKPEIHVQYASHLNQCSGAGQLGRRHLELLRVVEAAAMDRPQLAANAGVGIFLALRRREAVVEEDEIERRADPGNAGDEVHPADQQLQPLACVGFHVRA